MAMAEWNLYPVSGLYACSPSHSKDLDDHLWRYLFQRRTGPFQFLLGLAVHQLEIYVSSATPTSKFVGRNLPILRHVFGTVLRGSLGCQEVPLYVDFDVRRKDWKGIQPNGCVWKECHSRPIEVRRNRPTTTHCYEYLGEHGSHGRYWRIVYAYFSFLWTSVSNASYLKPPISTTNDQKNQEVFEASLEKGTD